MKQRIFEILIEANEQIQLNLEVENINASGRTSKSIRVEEYAGGVRLIKGADENTAPMSTLEIGRPGGAIPFNFQEIIKQWIIDKGLNISPIPYIRQPSEKWQPKYTPEERGLQYAAGAIAHKIKTVGTDRHLQKRNDIYSNVVKSTIDILKKEILGLVVETIKTN